MSSVLMCWKQEKMGKCEDLRGCDKGQIVMTDDWARVRTAAFVGCSCSAVVTIKGGPRTEELPVSKGSWGDKAH